jgi:hypothetical protein
MKYVIRFDGSHSLYRRRTSLGPEFTSNLAEACVFDSYDEAQRTLGTHHGFTQALVEPLDEVAHADALAAVDAPQIRQQYLGVLGLLAECSVHLRESSDSDELRALIEEALMDASGVIPSLKWKRVLNSFTVEVAQPSTSGKKKAS